jgi:hypothetical protein
MRNNITWFTRCKKCNCQLTNVGSGRPRNNCGNHRKIRLLISKTESLQRKLAYIQNKTKRQHELVIALKMIAGECYYHEQYFGHELLVTELTIRAFCWDHIDRIDKVATVAQMMGRNTDDEIIAEINKCVLSCTNCHQIKTYEDNDYISLKETKPIFERIETQLNLFAC